MAKSDGRSADAAKKAFNSFRPGKKGFKAPTEGLQYVVFNYTSSNNNKNVFVESVKKLSHHIAVSGSIRYEAPTAARAVRTLTAPTFENPNSRCLQRKVLPFQPFQQVLDCSQRTTLLHGFWHGD